MEIPEEFQTLNYNALLSGILRGALEMIGYKVQVEIRRDALKGEEVTDFHVVVIERIGDEYEPEDS